MRMKNGTNEKPMLFFKDFKTLSDKCSILKRHKLTSILLVILFVEMEMTKKETLLTSLIGGLLS